MLFSECGTCVVCTVGVLLWHVSDRIIMYNVLLLKEHKTKCVNYLILKKHVRKATVFEK